MWRHDRKNRHCHRRRIFSVTNEAQNISVADDVDDADDANEYDDDYYTVLISKFLARFASKIISMSVVSKYVEFRIRNVISYDPECIDIIQ